MTARTFTIALMRDGSMCAIPVPFDPAAVFGKVRAPVTVDINGHRFRSTISSMDGYWVPLRRSNREAAGLEGTETVEVTLTLDTEVRTVTPPADFTRALKATPPAWDRWCELPFTHQREYAEAVADAKKPETRARRIATSVAAIAARPARKSPARKTPKPAAGKPKRKG